MKLSSDLMKSIPLSDVKLEKGKYVAILRYQIPNRIILNGRRKTSPKFDTMYGLLYWLNKQPYTFDYVIYKTDKDFIIKEGFKRIGDIIE
jgi:hypothetical protein